MHESGSFVLRIERRLTFAAALGHHSDLDVSGLIENLVGEVQSVKPSFACILNWAEEDLGDPILVGVIDEPVRRIPPGHDGGSDVQVLREAEMTFDRLSF